MVDPSSLVGGEEAELDFEFLTEHSYQSFLNEVKRLVRKFEQELGSVCNQEALFPKKT